MKDFKRNKIKYFVLKIPLDSLLKSFERNENETNFVYCLHQGQPCLSSPALWSIVPILTSSPPPVSDRQPGVGLLLKS